MLLCMKNVRYNYPVQILLKYSVNRQQFSVKYLPYYGTGLPVLLFHLLTDKLLSHVILHGKDALLHLLIPGLVLQYNKLTTWIPGRLK